MGHTILVGNGINRVSSSGRSWKDILGDVAKKLNKYHDQKHIDMKPFTLAFDELILSAERRGLNREDLESIVAKDISKLKPNKYHKMVMTIGVQHILTTNYDYALELAIDQYHQKGSYDFDQKYNFFRYRSAGNVKVWHIHGEVKYPRSIILGYDNYTGTVQKMRQYIKAKCGYHNLRSPFRKGIYDFDKNGSDYSWVDIFLRDDVHIIGFGLDYIEIDLWWLIFYKADLEKRRNRAEGDRVKLKGKEVGKTYYYAFIDAESSSLDPAKRDSLKAFGVNVIDIKVDDIKVDDCYEDGWDRLLVEIKEQFLSKP